MSFLYINKTWRLNKLKTTTAMNAQISVVVICVEAIIHLNFFRRNEASWQHSSQHFFEKTRVSIILMSDLLLIYYYFLFNFSIHYYTIRIKYIHENNITQIKHTKWLRHCLFVGYSRLRNTMLTLILLHR